MYVTYALSGCAVSTASQTPGGSGIEVGSSEHHVQKLTNSRSAMCRGTELPSLCIHGMSDYNSNALYGGLKTVAPPRVEFVPSLAHH